MNVIWLMGFMFTLGLLEDGEDDSTLTWYEKAFCVIMCFFTWPLYLGHLCAKHLCQPKPKDTDNGPQG